MSASTTSRIEGAERAREERRERRLKQGRKGEAGKGMWIWEGVIGRLRREKRREKTEMGKVCELGRE